MPGMQEEGLLEAEEKPLGENSAKDRPELGLGQGAEEAWGD